jgi:membrane-associated phospholipid phosphatase
LNILHDLQWVLPLRTPALTQVAFGLSWLGYSTFIMFFMAIGYWSWNKAVFYRLLILVASNALLNAYLKDLFQDPRPAMELRLDDLVHASYGLPSGHAQLAVVLWMWLAWEVRRTGVWVLCGAIALGVMASRMYLGVHDLEDVLAGAILGGISLLVFEQVRQRQWRWQTSIGWNLVLIALATGVALLTWPGTAPEYIPTLAGWLAAAAWSLQIEKRHIGFTAPTVLWRRVAVGLLGAACFLGEQKLLKLTGTHLTLQALLWALLKGVVSGVFVSLLMPWVFCQLRLAPKILPTAAVHAN